MRARTTILVNVQRPVALFGLPPAWFALLLAGPLVPLLVCLPLGMPVAGVVLAVTVLSASAFQLYRLARRDPHVDRVARAGWRFHGFDRRRTERILQAGGKPPSRNRPGGGP